MVRIVAISYSKYSSVWQLVAGGIDVQLSLVVYQFIHIEEHHDWANFDVFLQITWVVLDVSLNLVIQTHIFARIVVARILVIASIRVVFLQVDAIYSAVIERII
jgi:hypothetical protein